MVSSIRAKFIVVFACSLAVAVFASGPSFALPTTTTTTYPVSESACSHGTNLQLCLDIPTVSVQTGAVLAVEFIASSGHCSDIIAHVLVDGVEQYVSPALGAGVSTGVQNLGPVSAGTHTVGVQAEGVLGGCNAGLLLSWAGTLKVTTSALFAGVPGNANCFGRSVSALGDQAAAAGALGYPSVTALHNAIHAYCGS
jgi:hypothetical protein